ncbi:MAG: hypothetical protein IPH49_16175 [Ignavibacteria bacterium]|nr:hypothetical protein [Ignavibacteria bacterium]
MPPELGFSACAYSSRQRGVLYLGETAANLRKVFDFIDATPWWNSFRQFVPWVKRGRASEHGELPACPEFQCPALINLDIRVKSLIIAATNHEGMLDSAIWRRFEKCWWEACPREQLGQLLRIPLRGVRLRF